MPPTPTPISHPPAHPRPRGQGGLASPTALKQIALREQALDLRRKGHSYRSIAREMGITLKAAHKLVTSAYKEAAQRTGETAEQLVRLQTVQLEGMLLALEGQIAAGNSRAIEVALRVLERYARLHGLDAPAKQEVKVSYTDLTDEELIAEAQRLKLAVVSALSVAAPVTLLPGEDVKQQARVATPLLLPGPVATDPGSAPTTLPPPSETTG